MDDETQKSDREDSAPWLSMLEKSGSEFDNWQSACDSIDKLYSDLDSLRGAARDRQLQIFWANIQVMGPSVYSRPPVPVVTPRFKDRRPVYRVASEMLERACSVSVDMGDIDECMLALRDDLIISGRGTPWVRYSDDEDDGKCVHYEHVFRKDFRHDCARKWSEVDWVARCLHLSSDDMRDRFGDAAKDYLTRRATSGKIAVDDESHPVWEIWCKSKKIVVWVIEGLDKVLERKKAPLNLRGFFPCPRPAYATLQRESLIPVPDVVYYKDQLEEVNQLTGRIHALADAIKVRGFFAGGGDLGDAIERAMKIEDDGKVLIPVPALDKLMASNGSGSPIMWMPLEMIASTIQGLVELRRQLFEDIYQIIGLSDIMRGMTDAGETLGAQQLKQQNGSYRVRDKQNELVRVARDMIRIGAEIMSEKFDKADLVEMSQMDLPTNAEVKKQLADMKKDAEAEAEAMTDQLMAKLAEQAQQQPESVPPADGLPPEMAQQVEQQLQQKYGPMIKQASAQVTVEQVIEFLTDEELRPYILEVETDSTVAQNEIAEKASRLEFLNAFTTAMGVVSQAAQAGPEAMALAGAVFKFTLAPYRVGRELEGMIDDLVDAAPQMAERMAQGGDDGPDEGIAAAQMELAKAEQAKVEAMAQNNQASAQLKMQEMQLRAQEFQAKMMQSQQELQVKAEQEQKKFGLELEKLRAATQETEARTEKLYAEIEKMGVDASNQTRAQDREDFKAAQPAIPGVIE